MSTPYLRRAFADNSTNSGTVTLSSPSEYEPTSTNHASYSTGDDGVHKLNWRPTDPGGNKKMLVIPFGRSFNTEFRLWIELFHVFRQHGGDEQLYIGTTTLGVDCVMSNAAYQEGGSTYGTPEMIASADRFVNKISVASGLTSPDGGTIIHNTVGADGDTAGNTTASIIINTYEASYVRFAVDINGGAGTGADEGNVLWTLL